MLSLPILCVFHYADELSQRAKSYSSEFWSFLQLVAGLVAILLAYIQRVGRREETRKQFHAESAAFVFNSSAIMYDRLEKKLEQERMKFPPNTELIEELATLKNMNLDFEQKAENILKDHFNVGKWEVPGDLPPKKNVENPGQH